MPEATQSLTELELTDLIYRECVRRAKPMKWITERCPAYEFQDLVMETMCYVQERQEKIDRSRSIPEIRKYVNFFITNAYNREIKPKLPPKESLGLLESQHSEKCDTMRRLEARTEVRRIARESLTSTEWNILAYIELGYSSEEIGDMLGYSRSHVRNTAQGVPQKMRRSA